MLENVPLIATIADFPNALEPLYIYGDKTVGHGFCVCYQDNLQLNKIR